MIIQKNDTFCKGKEVLFLPKKQEATYIQFLLKSNGLSFKSTGDLVGTTGELVLQVVKGKKRSRRVQSEIARILGHDDWNDVVIEARLAVTGVGRPSAAQIKAAKEKALKDRAALIAQKRKQTLQNIQQQIRGVE